MKTRITRLSALVAFAVSLAAFTGTAIADNGGGNGNGNNGNGNGNTGTPPGQATHASPPAAQPAAPPAAQPSPSTSHGNGKTPPGQAKQTAKASTSAPGVKPSNTTAKAGKWTHCATGGGTGTSATCTGNGPKPDSSKQYGNGKTAAQIANSRGAPAGTKLTGPGNSQPHKVAVCPKKNNKSGGVDVHAVKNYSTAKCAQQQSAAQKTQTPGAANAAATGGILGASPLTGTAQPAAGGVLGAQATLVKPAKAKAAGGVLGAVTRLGVAGAHATLPFTGLQLWVVVLIALGLIAGGFAVRAGRATAR